MLYGAPRLTRDIDITLGVDHRGLDRLLTAAADLSLKVLPDEIDAFVEETMVLPTQDETSGIRVDFIFSHSPYEQTAIERAREIEMLDQVVKFAAIEDLIIHKIFAGRPRDLEDVRGVLLRNTEIDMRYITRRLTEFDSAMGENTFLVQFESILQSIG